MSARWLLKVLRNIDSGVDDRRWGLDSPKGNDPNDFWIKAAYDLDDYCISEEEALRQVGEMDPRTPQQRAQEQQQLAKEMRSMCVPKMAFRPLKDCIFRGDALGPATDSSTSQDRQPSSHVARIQASALPPIPGSPTYSESQPDNAALWEGTESAYADNGESNHPGGPFSEACSAFDEACSGNEESSSHHFGAAPAGVALQALLTPEEVAVEEERAVGGSWEADEGVWKVPEDCGGIQEAEDRGLPAVCGSSIPQGPAISAAGNKHVGGRGEGRESLHLVPISSNAEDSMEEAAACRGAGCSLPASPVSRLHSEKRLALAEARRKATSEGASREAEMKAREREKRIQAARERALADTQLRRSKLFQSTANRLAAVHSRRLLLDRLRQEKLLARLSRVWRDIFVSDDKRKSLEAPPGVPPPTSLALP
eukprot:jgi/Botrbrau1/3281/Bobra.174_1s0047.2